MQEIAPKPEFKFSPLTIISVPPAITPRLGSILWILGTEYSFIFALPWIFSLVSESSSKIRPNLTVMKQGSLLQNIVESVGTRQFSSVSETTVA